MRYWRLFFVSFLLTFSIAGCRRKPQRALPPPHAQAPVVSTMPAMPPLTLAPVKLAESQPTTPAAPQPAAAPPKKHRAKVRRHRVTPKGEPEPAAAAETHPATTGDAAGGAASAAPGTALIGQLSADDSTATPTETAQAKHLIDATALRMEKVSKQRQAEHKDAVAQINSFLVQARQALSMNDVVGAQTLANKAKILVDELSK